MCDIPFTNDLPKLKLLSIMFLLVLLRLYGVVFYIPFHAYFANAEYKITLYILEVSSESQFELR